MAYKPSTLFTMLALASSVGAFTACAEPPQQEQAQAQTSASEQQQAQDTAAQQAAEPQQDADMTLEAQGRTYRLYHKCFVSEAGAFTDLTRYYDFVAGIITEVPNRGESRSIGFNDVPRESINRVHEIGMTIARNAKDSGLKYHSGVDMFLNDCNTPTSAGRLTVPTAKPVG